MEKLRVADFYCGAGGFSEGFAQANFAIVFAVDKWEPAATTHAANHPGATTILDDVERISRLSDFEFHKLVPDTEVIIGSPPCVAFSNSNKSGNGDKAEGIKLIEAYLRIVARKKWKEGSILKYWILENVPKVESYIKDEYSAKKLSLPGSNILKVKNESTGIYNAQDFGVPSRRKRYFCGDFPAPAKSTVGNKALTLGDVLNALGEPKENPEGYITDPIYNFRKQSKNVSDHHYLHVLAEHQWKAAKRLKLDKGYMGRMSFPEDITKPARTVMATLSFSVRESMVLGHKGNKYRVPTIREIASLMSFPIDYMFYGDSVGTKYRLVGNAVPPLLAYSFAREIGTQEKRKISGLNAPQTRGNHRAFTNLNFLDLPISKEIQRSPKAKFKYHIPYLISKGYRVELTNHQSNFLKNTIIWSTEIHKGQGPNARIYVPTTPERWLTKLQKNNLDLMLLLFKNKLVGFNQLQEFYRLTSAERQAEEVLGPFELLEKIGEMLNDYQSPSEIIFKGKPYRLPGKIAAGYYLLHQITQMMGRLKNE